MSIKLDEDLVEEIVEWVEHEYSPSGYRHNTGVFGDYVEFQDNRDCVVLFMWNGESLYGPYVCDSHRPCSFKAIEE